jgi:hypothetical protein
MVRRSESVLNLHKILNEHRCQTWLRMATEHTSSRAPISTRRSGIALGILAAALLAHPVYLWPNLGSDPGAKLLAGFVRPILTLLGGVVLPYAGLVAYRGSWRPVTPETALLFPVTASVAVLGLQWYDEVVLEVVGFQPLDNNPVLVAAISLVFLVGGSLVRRERREALLAFVLGCLALFLVGVFVDGTRPPIALVSGVALGIAGAVVGALGYVLTSPS